MNWCGCVVTSAEVGWRVKLTVSVCMCVRACVARMLLLLLLLLMMMLMLRGQHDEHCAYIWNANF